MATLTAPPGPLPRQVGISAQFIRVTAVNDIENTFNADILLYSKWCAPEHADKAVDEIVAKLTGVVPGSP